MMSTEIALGYDKLIQETEMDFVGDRSQDEERIRGLMQRKQVSWID